MWLTLGVASLVIIFGLYRIAMVFRNSADEARARERRGLFGLAGRTHFLIGVIYLMLGGALVATTFGWNPLSDVFTTTPTDGAAPAAPTAPGGGKAIRVDSAK